jgi:hypothetical protein
MSTTVLLPYWPDAMTPAQAAAVSFLARYRGHTHELYTHQLRRWFGWCEANGLDPLTEIQRAHVELYIRHLGESGLMDSSVITMMNGVRGFFRFAHIDGLVSADPAVYARLLKLHHDESRTQGLDRLELIRFLQVASTITVHHGALAYLLGINALRASEAAAVRIDDYAQTLRGHRVLHLVGKGNSRPRCPSPSQCYVSWKPAAGSAPKARWCSGQTHTIQSTGATSTEWCVGSRRQPASLDTLAPTPCAMLRSPTPSTPASRFATPKSWPATPTPEPPSTTTARAET